MAKRTYPIMLEPAASGGYGVIFPDFDGCVSFGVDAGTAMKNAEEALSLHIEGMAEDGEPLPDATEMRDLVLDYPDRTSDSVWAFVTIETPDASERVNVYMAKSLLERIDRFLGESGGRNRSAFFTIATRRYLEHEAAGMAKATGVSPSLHHALWASTRAVETLGKMPLAVASDFESTIKRNSAMQQYAMHIAAKPSNLIASGLADRPGPSFEMMTVDRPLSEGDVESALESAAAALRRLSLPGNIALIHLDTGEIATIDTKSFPTAASAEPIGKKTTT
jgi:predicted RNase H-like HicB family nuclease